MTYSLSKCLLFLRYTNIRSHKRYNRQSRSLHTIEVTTFTAYTHRTPHTLTHTVTQTLQGRRVQQLHVITKAGTLSFMKRWSSVNTITQDPSPQGSTCFLVRCTQQHRQLLCVWHVYIVHCSIQYVGKVSEFAWRTASDFSFAWRSVCTSRPVSFFCIFKVLRNHWKKLNDGDGWCGGSITHFGFISWKTQYEKLVCSANPPLLKRVSQPVASKVSI